MTQKIEDLMTPDPVAMQSSTPIVDAARAMRERNIGDVIVLEDGRICGVVTDRDIVIRGIAEGVDPSSTSLSQVCSRDLVTLDPTDDVEKAITLMRERAIRRVPVVRDGKPVGIVSLGDLAVERDPSSALAEISAAPGNT